MFPRIPNFPTIKMSFADLSIVVLVSSKQKRMKKTSMKSISDLKYDKSNRGCIIFSARAAVSTFILKQHLCWGSIYARAALMQGQYLCLKDNFAIEASYVC